MHPSDKQLAETLSLLIDCNPFRPQRTQLERQALGSAFRESEADWTLDPNAFTSSDNLRQIAHRAADLQQRMGQELRRRKSISLPRQNTYQDVVYYVLYSHFRNDFQQLIEDRGASAGRVYVRFRRQYHEAFDDMPMSKQMLHDCSHMFALLFQLYRAFRNLFDHMIGGSTAIIQLRAAVWESIFTCDVRRYRDALFHRMSEFTTLITGPSGSGKELVARAIGMSGYNPFDERSNRFLYAFDEMFHSLNLSAMNPLLIESELFGHRKGAFTGADQDRVGWLATCPTFGTIFLDEIGELDKLIQVKLLRVLQEREFQAVGDTQLQRFQGRILAATNRDVAASVDEGLLRSDFVYRICSDQIHMPSLAARCHGRRQELAVLVQHLLQRITGENDAQLASEIHGWIDQHLGEDYGWPGNVRELEQCIRSYLVRKNYHPFSESKSHQLLAELARCTMTAEELMTAYCTVVYSKNRNYVATAKHLGMDRRTVKAHVDEALLETLAR